MNSDVKPNGQSTLAPGEIMEITGKPIFHHGQWTIRQETVLDNPELLNFETGAKRSTVGEETRYDLISEFGLYRLAKTYQEGTKYGDNNWRNGMPFSCLINRVLRHINEWKQGDRGEDHLAHAAWGLFALMEFEATKPEMHDLYAKPHKESGQ